jgi:hypothetical protein
MVCLAQVGKAVPMGTAWTYQGRLMDANYPGDGLYDFQFDLYDANVGGSHQGPTIDINDLDVIDGYFTVLLDFGSDVFNGDARWLEIGVRPGDSENLVTTLGPRQEVTPTPYSLQTRGLFVDESLNVGIGTTSPAYKFHINETNPGANLHPMIDNNFRHAGLVIDCAANYDTSILFREAGMNKFMIQNDGTTDYGLGIFEYGGPGFVTVWKNGRVGIGTTSPLTGLHVKGTGWPNAFMTLQSDPNEDTGIRLNEGATVKWHFFNESGADGLGLRNTAFSSVLFAEQSTGDIGLGTTSPRTDLEIEGTTGLRVTTGQHSNVFGDFKHAYSGGLIINANAGGGWADMSLQTDGTTRMFIESGGNVGIGMGTEVPPERLTVRGNILVQSSSGASVAEIGEGLDYAEGFDVTEDADIKAGTVLVIDSDNPGKLTVSRSAYDSKVAGIVAGAKGLGSGVRLGIGQFDHDVALAGRVYCNVDATDAAVLAGDLLTTSGTAGHAMKATNYDRARGAILGKAMQKFQKGQKGQILVLVTLQ